MATGRINAARNNDICCITIVFHSLAVLAVSFGGERLLGNKREGRRLGGRHFGLVGGWLKTHYHYSPLSPTCSESELSDELSRSAILLVALHCTVLLKLFTALHCYSSSELELTMPYTMVLTAFRDRRLIISGVDSPAFFSLVRFLARLRATLRVAARRAFFSSVLGWSNPPLATGMRRSSSAVRLEGWYCHTSCSAFSNQAGRGGGVAGAGVAGAGLAGVFLGFGGHLGRAPRFAAGGGGDVGHAAGCGGVAVAAGVAGRPAGAGWISQFRTWRGRVTSLGLLRSAALLRSIPHHFWYLQYR